MKQKASSVDGKFKEKTNEEREKGRLEYQPATTRFDQQAVMAEKGRQIDPKKDAARNSVSEKIKEQTWTGDRSGNFRVKQKEERGGEFRRHDEERGRGGRRRERAKSVKVYMV